MNGAARIASAWLLACLFASTGQAAAHAKPSGWSHFAVILWHSDTPPPPGATYRALGITAGRLFGQRDHFDRAALRRDAQHLRAQGLAPMVENIATDFYAPYHRWRPGLSVTAAMTALHDRYKANPHDPALWRREPSLSDPNALAAIEHRLTAHSQALRGTNVLYDSLADETGIADLSAAWDFDESPPALAAWRHWLARHYGSLAALDRAWGTDHASWNTVTPTRTDDALAGTGPCAGWMDMKAWMDLAFAQAIARGTAAIHRGDPTARAAIEGAQLPGWGGYDYADLAGAADVMDLTPGYTQMAAIGFHPGLLTLTTSANTSEAEASRLWRFLLQGGRGVVLWDPDGKLVRDPALPRLLAALHGADADTILAAKPVRDPIAILYSQASFRLAWLLDRRADRARGLNWTSRDNDTELADSPWRDALQTAAESLLPLGRNPVWLDADRLSKARLAGLHTIILPHAIALDDTAIVSLRRFAAHGGDLIADTEPGLYDTLGRPRPSPPLKDIGRRLARLDTRALRTALPAYVTCSGSDPTGCDQIALFRYDDDHLLAIQRAETGQSTSPCRLTAADGTTAMTIGLGHPTLWHRPVPDRLAITCGK